MSLAGCTGGPRPSPTAAPSPTTVGCATDHPAAPLPEWAQGGFFPPARPMPHVLGDRSEIVAILWAEHHPLQVPPPVDRNNKILWVTRDGSGGPLEIRATLRASGESVTRSLAEGPGPSVVDLPAPGCWSLDLSWDRHHDHLNLAYAPR